MYNKTNLIITGATVAMLLLPMKTDAQKLESCPDFITFLRHHIAQIENQ